MDHVTAIFETRSDAERALIKLEALGVTENQVSVLTTDEARGDFVIKNNSKAEEGATTGAALGGLSGAVLAALVSTSAMVIPGLNLVVSGYLVSAVAGFGIGTAAGSILGALVGLGFPEYEAKLYEEELSDGHILVAVKPVSNGQKKEVKKILDEAKTSRARTERDATDIDRGGIII
ncbi:MAG: hypothetical protein WBK55_10390 [Alphaproteobacteria bacterium]